MHHGLYYPTTLQLFLAVKGGRSEVTCATGVVESFSRLCILFALTRQILLWGTKTLFWKKEVSDAGMDRWRSVLYQDKPSIFIALGCQTDIWFELCPFR